MQGKATNDRETNWNYKGFGKKKIECTVRNSSFRVALKPTPFEIRHEDGRPVYDSTRPLTRRTTVIVSAGGMQQRISNIPDTSMKL